jgi:hypothetical protein
VPSKRVLLSGVVLFVLFYPFVGSVGASSMMWSQTYGGAADDEATAVIQTSDGGYALAGYTNSFGAGGYDFWLVKTDAYGNMEWNQTYGGAVSERASSLVETSDGGYAIAGSTHFSSGPGAYDCWLVKTDAHGNTEWKQTYSGADNEIVSALVETSDGGYAYSTGVSCQLVKTDAQGNIQWNRTYGGEGFYSLESLVATSDGGYALAGSAGFITTSFWLVKTDEYGNMEWSNEYGEYGTSTARSLVETSDGGYALAGESNPFGPEDFDVLLVKTDSNGNMEWSKTYRRTGWEIAHSVVKTSDGGYAIAGTINAYTTDNSDFLLVKTDVYGNMEWNRTYGGTGNEWGCSLVETSDGGYAIAGETSSFGAGDSDFWVVKTDESGVIPEFPSWIILPLVLTVTFGVLFLKKRLMIKMQRENRGS